METAFEHRELSFARGDAAGAQAPDWGAHIRREWESWKHRLSSLGALPAALELIWKASPSNTALNLVSRVVGALIPVASLWVAKQIVDLVAAGSRGANADTTMLWLLVSAEFLLAALGTLAGRVADYCDARIAEEFSREVSQKVIGHATELDLTHFEDPAFQDLLERARLQATDRAMMLSDMGRLFQQAIALISVSMAIVFMAPWLLVLVVVALIPGLFTESHFAFASYKLAYEVTPQRRQLDYLRQLCTSASSIKEVKLFGLGAFFQERFTGITNDLIGKSRALAARRLRVCSLLAVISSFGYFAAYAVLVTMAVRHEISLGTLTFLAGTLAASSASFQGVFSLISKIADDCLFLGDLFKFLEVKPAATSTDTPRLEVIPGARSTERGVEFRNVSFRYPGTERTVLRNVNLRIEPAERIALVGPNGNGKTTLVKLLSRLYDPTSGSILLDGVDLRDFPREELWKRIGVIFQDFVRYEMTAAENIAMGQVEHAHDLARIHEAARAAGADEVLARLPKGLDQLLGRRFEGGVDLSGGEWQRLALARAYLRNSDILVLDEPTAALDAKAESEVFARFAELAEGRMTLLISHRMATVRMAHRILVIEDGTIREQGTHNDLIAQRGQYAQLFELQAANYR